jgi:pyrimidine and pyridine-specific 5'-nucleotidase
VSYIVIVVANSYSINAQWMISVGSDKAIVVWDWRSGNKVVRFGQQTNVCVGMNLLDNFVITATVDGVIRTFSIQKREMLGSFKLSDLAARQPEYASKLKEVGVGALGMLTWFEAEGRFMACATKDIVIRLAWDWATPEEQQEMEDGVPSSQSPSKDAAVAPPRPRLSAGVASSPRPQSPATPRRAAASPVHKAAPTGSKLIDTLTNVSDDVAATSGTASKYAFMRAPRIVEILDITGTERGAFEAGRVRIITSRRLSAKAGAERRVIVGTERLGENGEPTMKLVSLGGKWDTQGREGGLHTAAKNPMSLALDHDKLVVSTAGRFRPKLTSVRLLGWLNCCCRLRGG